MNYGDYISVIRPWVHGLRNFHNVNGSKNQDMDFWTNFCPVAGVIDNPTRPACAATGTFKATFASIVLQQAPLHNN